MGGELKTQEKPQNSSKKSKLKVREALASFLCPSDVKTKSLRETYVIFKRFGSVRRNSAEDVLLVFFTDFKRVKGSVF